MPRCIDRICFRQHLFVDIAVSLIVNTFDTSRCQGFPAASQGILVFGDILFLLLLRNMGKKLDYTIPAQIEGPFIIVDFMKRHIVPFRCLVRITYIMFIAEKIPGTVMDTDSAHRGQLFPELGEEGTHLLPLRRL